MCSGMLCIPYRMPFKEKEWNRYEWAQAGRKNERKVETRKRRKEENTERQSEEEEIEKERKKERSKLTVTSFAMLL